MGLDRPAIIQYLSYHESLSRGISADPSRMTCRSDLSSCRDFRSPFLWRSFRWSLPFCSIPMGIYSALHRNRAGDYGVMVFSQIGLAVPAFWAGILLILFFAVILHWFPAGGFQSWDVIRSKR